MPNPKPKTLPRELAKTVVWNLAIPRGTVAEEKAIHEVERLIMDERKEIADIRRQLAEQLAESQRMVRVAENAFKLQDAANIPGKTGELNCLQIAKAWLALEKRAEAAEQKLAAANKQIDCDARSWKILRKELGLPKDSIDIVQAIRKLKGVALPSEEAIARVIAANFAGQAGFNWPMCAARAVLAMLEGESDGTN